LNYRKQLLQGALAFEKPLRFTNHVETKGEAYYSEACQQGWEGIIAKDGESSYVSSRSREWLKFKCVNEQELSLVTTPIHRDSVSALVLC
jgi:bifunctional non-homologous end joining protein LigD